MRKILVVILCVIVSLALVGCANQPAATTSAAASTQPSMTATAMPSTQPSATASAAVKKVVGCNFFDTSLLWQSDADQCKKLAADRGWDVVVATSNGDVQKCVQNAQSFITQKCDYVYFNTSDAGNMSTVQGMFDAAGIPCIMSGLSETNYIQVTQNDYEASYDAGQKVGDAVNAKWNGQYDIIISAGLPSLGQLNADRMKGLLEGFESKVPGVDTSKIVNGDVATIDPLVSTNEMTNLLTANPDAKRIVLLGFMDQFEVVPMINAANAAGRITQLLMGCTVVSDPAAPAYLKQYKDEWVGTEDWGGPAYANEVFALLDKMAAGQTVPKGMYYIKSTWIDSTNVDQYYPSTTSSSPSPSAS